MKTQNTLAVSSAPLMNFENMRVSLKNGKHIINYIIFDKLNKNLRNTYFWEMSEDDNWRAFHFTTTHCYKKTRMLLPFLILRMC